MVGDVLVACGSLLRQGVAPSEQGEDRTDEVLFGDRFVGTREPAERLEHAAEAVPERGERARPAYGRAPLGRRADAVGEEVLGEQLAGHDVGPLRRLLSEAFRFRQSCRMFQ